MPVAAIENEEGMVPSRAVVLPSVGPLLSLHDAGGLVWDVLHSKSQLSYPRTVPVHNCHFQFEGVIEVTCSLLPIRGSHDANVHWAPLASEMSSLPRVV